MAPKKILILVNHDLTIYHFRKELVQELLDRGYEVIISSPNGVRIKKLIDMGCKYEEIILNRHGTNPIEDLKLIYTYHLLIKNTTPDLVLTFTIKPNIYGGFASALNNIPYLVNVTGLGTALEKPGFLQKLTTILYKISMSKVDTIFFQNQDNLDFFKYKRIGRNRYRLLPGSGVNLNDFPYLKYPDNDEINFVFISRIMREKGIDEFLQTAKHIKLKYPNTAFHVCGFCEEDYIEILENYQSQGIIEYHGMIEDVSKFLQKMHCTIHPTYYPEGMSNVLLESAASGRPIITTDRSGTREIVKDNINGYIVEAKNINSLVASVEKFLKLPHKNKIQMGLEGRKHVAKKFDRNIVVEKYLESIKKVFKI